MTSWKKFGLVLRPDPRLPWMNTHAMIPSPLQIEGSLYRIYFSGRDVQNRSHIGYASVDLREPERILEVRSEHVLAPGRLGCFDDNGVTPSCLVRTGDEILLYYIGWNPGTTTRMHIFGGLAVSRDGGDTFTRYSEAPIIERSRANPFINTAPFVLRLSDSDWRMYYVSGVEWQHKDLPRYNIQVGFSKNGRDWMREGQVCIDFLPGENALARPFVLKENSVYQMWFASKGENYRLQYAESTDGLLWHRKPERLLGLDVTPGGPDSQMMEYAAPLSWDGRRIIYYNGNDYGRNGICLAVEE